MQYTKKDLINLIQGVFDSDDKINKKVDYDDFIKTYFGKIIKRLKQSNSKYKFNRDEYQTAIKLYLLLDCFNLFIILPKYVLIKSS